MEGSGDRAKVAVLVVDDDADVRQLFRLYLAKLGPLELNVCATSSEAVQLLEVAWNRQLPSSIFTLMTS